MSKPPHPAIERYARGEISANRAADLLGLGFTVADVFVLTLQAGLQPPRLSPDKEAAELAHACKVLGLR